MAEGPEVFLKLEDELRVDPSARRSDVAVQVDERNVVVPAAVRQLSVLPQTNLG